MERKTGLAAYLMRFCDNKARGGIFLNQLTKTDP